MGRGLVFCARVLAAAPPAGIKPLVNLFHWALPQALQDGGGFADPGVVDSVSEDRWAGTARLGDRVSNEMPFNEPAVYAFLGHADGIPAPGLRHWPTALRVADN